jgi:uncharacterized protein YdaU (DUF1376 family)
MGDFAKKTAHLSMTEQGAYDRLLDHYYAMIRPLPAELSALFQIAKAMSGLERKAVGTVANEFFPIGPDGLRHNKRADEEIARHEAQAAKNREIGKLGGRPKQTEALTESVTESDSEIEPNGNPKPEAIKNQDQKLLPPDGFVRFWQTWPSGPRKASKGKCLTLWKRKRFEMKADEIISHVEAMKATASWRSGYDPAPFQYLKDERWDGADIHSIEDKRKVAW